MKDLTKARYNELDRLIKKHGGKLKRSDIVKRAENPKNPLHDYFDWDDAVAGQKWREEQAGQLVRSYMLTITEETETYKIPAFVRDPDMEPHEQGYTSVKSARSTADVKAEVLIQAFDRIRVAVQRAKDLAKYFSLEDRFDNFIEMIEVVEKDLSAVRRSGRDRPRPNA